VTIDPRTGQPYRTYTPVQTYRHTDPRTGRIVGDPSPSCPVTPRTYGTVTVTR
jgi:hypothetical protein